MFTIFQDLKMNLNDSNGALLYFFCDKRIGDPTRQNPDSILRTLIAQALLNLLETNKRLIQHTLDLYKSYETEKKDIPLWLLN